MTADSPSPLVRRWRGVLARMRAAEAEAGRAAGSARLVAVSKGFGAEAVGELLAAGQRTFGENRVQEAQAKWPALLRRHPDAELRFVGRLQSNKAADAVRLVHVIESVDRESVAQALAGALLEAGREVRLLVQVNLGEEPRKGGCAPLEADEFVAWCRRDLGLPVAGAMGIPPRGEDPVPYFGLLRALCRRAGLGEISMGMSADFEDAILMGATHVRVGTGVFGPRG